MGDKVTLWLWMVQNWNLLIAATEGGKSNIAQAWYVNRAGRLVEVRRYPLMPGGRRIAWDEIDGIPYPEKRAA